MDKVYEDLYSKAFKRLLEVEGDFIYVAVCANQLLRAIEMKDEDNIKASASVLREALVTHFDPMMEARKERDKHLLKDVFGVGE